MTSENYFSHRLLVLAANVKEAIDVKFNFVTGTPLQTGKVNISIDPNHQEWKNAETFARELNVNRKELQRAFKYYNHGKGINEYQAEKKIEAACILLSNGEKTIKEIAVELDFTQNYFSYFFKKQMGMTPIEWQKTYGNKKTVLKS